MILNALLFCFILLLCFISFAGGFYLGLKQRPKPEPKKEPEPLTEEQERQIKKRQKETENFWGYDGSDQE